MPIAKIGASLAPKAGIKYFLPFPEEIDKKAARMSKHTAQVFLKLARAGQLPHRVVGAAGPLMEEMIALIGGSK